MPAVRFERAWTGGQSAGQGRAMVPRQDSEGDHADVHMSDTWKTFSVDALEMRQGMRVVWCVPSTRGCNALQFLRFRRAYSICHGNQC